MKKIAVALATLSLILAPVAITGASAKPEAKPKCSASDVRSQNALDALAKVAKSKEAKAIAKAAKIKSEHSKAKSAHSKAKSAKSLKVKTLAELEAKATKLTTSIAAQNVVLETATGTARTKGLKKLADLTKELAKVNAAITKATAEVTVATNAVEDAAENVAEAAEEVEVVETEVEEVKDEVAETTEEVTKAKGKCKR
jgi:chromosome segregation ATPase